jgi:hypothetical protein
MGYDNMALRVSSSPTKPIRWKASTGWPQTAYSNPDMKEEPGLQISQDEIGPVVNAVENEHFNPQWSRLISKVRVLGERYRLDLTWVIKHMWLREEPDG